MLKENCVWSIGDGRKICIWEDIWLPEAGCLQDYKVDGFDYVWQLIDQMNGCSKEDVVECLMPPCIVEDVLIIPLSKAPCKDRLEWMHNKSGKFFV